MNCPLLVAAWLHWGKSIDDPPVSCGEEKCAWYDEDKGRCSMVTIARMSDLIYDRLTEISRKLPLGATL